MCRQGQRRLGAVGQMLRQGTHIPRVRNVTRATASGGEGEGKTREPARAGSLKQIRLTPVEGTSGSCHRSCGRVRLRWGHRHRYRCFRAARP